MSLGLGATRLAPRFVRSVSLDAAGVYAGTLMLSALLLFALQPMFSKMVLPLLGGTPAVWNTAVAFFQAVLLLGYLYAHALTKLTNLRLQALIHVAVLLVGGLFLPIAVTSILGEPPSQGQALWLFALYGASVGAPFFAVSATAPLLQAWYARTGRPDASDPYHLYAASNIGSLAALLGYPILIEPLLTTGAQSASWTGGYALLGAAIVVCVVLAARAGGLSAVSTERASVALDAEAVKARLWSRVRWVALAFVPSSALLGGTTHITTDVASAPFLWVAPLALFILTFVMVFARKPWIPHALAVAALPIALIVATLKLDWTFLLPANLFVIFAIALVFHGELVRIRPDASRLTEFYLFMSLGGVLGGAFNAFVAPVVFDNIAEYPLILLAAAMMRPVSGSVAPSRMAFAAVVSAVLIGLCMLTWSGLAISIVGMKLALVAAVVAGCLVRDHRWLFAGVIASTLIAAQTLAPVAGSSFQSRSFFGVHRILEQDGYRYLFHGTTIHGMQSLTEEGRPTPMSYYGPKTPIGTAFAALQEAGRADRVGLVGLGAGASACHSREGQAWTVFEIDPVVVKLAQRGGAFSYLENCAPDARIVLGDARLTLGREPNASYDAFLIDTFSSDAIPAHMLTKEAFATYLSKIDEDGVLIVHIPNRVMELQGPIADIAHALGASAYVKTFVADDEDKINHSTRVAVIARNEAALAPILADAAWKPLPRAKARVWTDDFSNLPRAIWAMHFGW